MQFVNEQTFNLPDFNGTVIWIGCETTGSNIQKNNIFKLAAVVTQGNTIIEKKEWKFRPPKNDEWNNNLPHVSKKEVYNYTKSKYVLPDIKSFFNKYPNAFIGGHKIKYDIPMLNKIFKKNYGQNFFTQRCIDTYTIASFFQEKNELIPLCKKHKIPFTEPYKAMNIALATINYWFKLQSKLFLADPDNFDPLQYYFPLLTKNNFFSSINIIEFAELLLSKQSMTLRKLQKLCFYANVLVLKDFPYKPLFHAEYFYNKKFGVINLDLAKKYAAKENLSYSDSKLPDSPIIQFYADTILNMYGKFSEIELEQMNKKDKFHKKNLAKEVITLSMIKETINKAIVKKTYSKIRDWPKK